MPVKQEQTTPAIWFELSLTARQTPIAYFSEISGLAAEIETMSYNEGGKNDGVHKLPTRMKHPNLVLKRGVTTVKDLQEWVLDSFMGPQRKTITLTMLNQEHETLRTWSFKNAYPVKWTGPTFNVGQAAVATEVLEIVHDGIQIGV